MESVKRERGNDSGTCIQSSSKASQLPCGKPNYTVYDAVGQRAGFINIKISCWPVSKWVAKQEGEGEVGYQWLDDASVCGSKATVVGPQLIN